MLDERIQRWIWEQRWDELRDIQEKAIHPILGSDTDLIISSPTASGKTEAAFLPILSRIVAKNASQGLSVVYIGPLKALINDQFERLQVLCEALDVDVWRWHGDVSQSTKNSLLKHPRGVLLITPESLESLMINHSYQIPHLFSSLSFVVIDELHSFIGTERGSQLQSLLDRLEGSLKTRVSRIGLSATLSNMSLAKTYLRHDKSLPCLLVEGGRGQQEMKAQLRGYRKPAPKSQERESDKSSQENEGPSEIARDLFKILRGQTNLVFANRRADVEIYTDTLRRLCEEQSVPNEFWPHHGSLSKSLREDVERIVKDKSMPSTVISTATLELGIDIGMVNSVAQIGPPPSVSSLRQRLGRSGRRGQPAILRMFVLEEEITPDSHPHDSLRSELVQSMAMLDLLIQGWYEPPINEKLHLSTLVHQTLSLIAQYGGIRAASGWEILCGSGPFGSITKEMYSKLLKGLGARQVLTQDSEGLLLLGPVGEKIVNHYSFYTVFLTPEEFSLVTQEGTLLGTLPIDFPVSIGSFLIFGGRRWEAIDIDLERHVVVLTPSKGGRPPQFGGSGRTVHDRVRQEMFNLYKSTAIPAYLNTTATSMLAEGRGYFRQLKLDLRRIVQYGNGVLVFPWRGDLVMNTLTLQLQSDGFKVSPEGIALNIAEVTDKELTRYFQKLPSRPLRNPVELGSFVKNKIFEKFDPYLTDELLEVGYASGNIVLSETATVINEIISSQKLAERD